MLESLNVILGVVRKIRAIMLGVATANADQLSLQMKMVSRMYLFINF